MIFLEGKKDQIFILLFLFVLIKPTNQMKCFERGYKLWN